MCEAVPHPVWALWEFMKKLLVATTNPAKLAEYREFLSDLPLKLVSLIDVGITQVSPEDKSTFEENAILKALFYNQLSGLPTIADDGGFEIEYLNGAPGVKSHRWTGMENPTDADIIAFTLEKMKNVQQNQRNAQLRLVLAYAFDNNVIATVEEKVKGTLANKASSFSKKGFPYRSLLFFPNLNKYYDELTPSEMEEYNHRKKAVQKLKSFFKKSLL